MKKQIQLAGTYDTLKYIKNQFNLLKKKKHKQQTYSYNQGFEPRRKKIKKDLKDFKYQYCGQKM